MNIDKDSLQSLALRNLTVEDIAHKIFLKPFEITLRTNKTDPSVAIGDLPQGIRIALKQNIFDNAFEPIAFNPLQPTSSLSQIQANNTDNMISYLKSQGNLQIAICICMYSESKRMLKDTLKGVEDNIAEMIKSGVNPDVIGVFVIVDGIQKLDQSVLTGYEEFQRESGVNIEQKNDRDLIEEVEQEQRMSKENNFSLEEFVQKHMSNLVFNTVELEDREERRLPNVCQQYKNFKKTRSILIKLRESKESSNIYELLPQKIKEDFFLKQAKQQKLRQLQQKGQNHIQSQIKKQALIQQFAYNPAKARKVGLAAINKAIAYIDKFLSIREQLSYLACFRKRIYQPVKVTAKGQFIEEPTTNKMMNLFFCIKYKNAGKLSSHNWFFNGFCKELNPKHVILLDVGLKPSGQSIFNMYKHLKQNPNVGGVCGYMQLRLQKLEDEEQVKEEQIDWLSSFSLNLFDIQKAQQIEYHLAHMIDKPFQSAFNFIHVLPGAFSGYSMDALKSKDNQDKLLKEYFRSIEEKLMETTIKPTNITLYMVLLRVFLPEFLYNFFYGVQPQSEQEMLYNQNIYFAEDRILCMQIHNNGKDLAFLPDACAEVDPMKTVQGLMGQRKRWMNGSYFAFQKVKKQITSCDILLRLQVVFYNFINIFIYFAPSLFFFTVHITMTSFRQQVLTDIIKNIQASPQTNQQLLDFFVYTIDLIYALIIGAIIFFSLTTPANRPIFKPYIYFASTVLGWLAISVFILYLVDVIRGLINGTLFLLQGTDQLETGDFKTLLQINRWFVVGVFGLYILPVLFYCILFCTLKPMMEAIKAAFSFLFYNPTYFIILTFYSLCRIDDISWGTKGLNSQSNQQSAIKQKWKMIKLIHVGKYLLWNVVASVLLLSFAEDSKPKFYISFVIIISIILTVGLKILIGLIYLLKYKCQSACKRTEKPNGENNEARNSKFDDFANSFKGDVQKSIKQRIDDMAIDDMRKDSKVLGGASYISIIRKLQHSKQINRKDYKQLSIVHEKRSAILKARKK